MGLLDKCNLALGGAPAVSSVDADIGVVLACLSLAASDAADQIVRTTWFMAAAHRLLSQYVEPGLLETAAAAYDVGIAQGLNTMGAVDEECRCPEVSGHDCQTDLEKLSAFFKEEGIAHGGSLRSWIGLREQENFPEKGPHVRV